MNLTPLLDIIFCLLFFFIVATSIKQERHALDVTIPKSGQSTRKVLDQPRLEVLITKENEIVFQGEKMTGPQLAVALGKARREMLAARPGGPNQKPPVDEILIRTDGTAHIQTFVEVSDACAKAGLKAAIMETKPRIDNE